MGGKRGGLRTWARNCWLLEIESVSSVRAETMFVLFTAVSPASSTELAT